MFQNLLYAMDLNTQNVIMTRYWFNKCKSIFAYVYIFYKPINSYFTDRFG